MIGSRFGASYADLGGGQIRPSITGRAYVTGEALLLRDPDDPFGAGIRAG